MATKTHSSLTGTDLHVCKVHGASHTDGTDNIQLATSTQSGVATATQIGKLDDIEELADVTDAANVADAGAVMDSDISEAEGIMRKTGAGTYTAIKTNLAATVAPTDNDDIGDEYVVGSRWIDITADKEYVCLDNGSGAAVWTETTGSGGGSGADTTMDCGTATSIYTGTGSIDCGGA